MSASVKFIPPPEVENLRERVQELRQHETNNQALAILRALPNRLLETLQRDAEATKHVVTRWNVEGGLPEHVILVEGALRAKGFPTARWLESASVIDEKGEETVTLTGWMSLDLHFTRAEFGFPPSTKERALAEEKARVAAEEAAAKAAAEAALVPDEQPGPGTGFTSASEPPQTDLPPSPAEPPSPADVMEALVAATDVFPDATPEAPAEPAAEPAPPADGDAAPRAADVEVAPADVTPAAAPLADDSADDLYDDLEEDDGEDD